MVRPSLLWLFAYSLTPPFLHPQLAYMGNWEALKAKLQDRKAKLQERGGAPPPTQGKKRKRTELSDAVAL